MLHSEDFGKVFAEMELKKLYQEILLIADTCEAMSLFDQVNAQNIIMIGTSVHDQHAFSYQTDGQLNTYLNDRFTAFFYKFLNEKSAQLSRTHAYNADSNKSLKPVKITEFP